MRYYNKEYGKNVNFYLYFWGVKNNLHYERTC